MKKFKFLMFFICILSASCQKPNFEKFIIGQWDRYGQDFTHYIVFSSTKEYIEEIFHDDKSKNRKGIKFVMELDKYKIKENIITLDNTFVYKIEYYSRNTLYVKPYKIIFTPGAKEKIKARLKTFYNIDYTPAFKFSSLPSEKWERMVMPNS